MNNIINSSETIAEDLQFPAVSVLCDDELILLQKMIHHYSYTWVTRGKNQHRAILNQKLRLLLALYFKFGYNEETKLLASKAFKVPLATIHQYNHNLTKKGYLVIDADYVQQKHFNQELQAFQKYYKKCLDNGKPIFFLVKFSLK